MVTFFEIECPFLNFDIQGTQVRFYNVCKLVVFLFFILMCQIQLFYLRLCDHWIFKSVRISFHFSWTVLDGEHCSISLAVILDYSKTMLGRSRTNDFIRCFFTILEAIYLKQNKHCMSTFYQRT